MTRHALPVILAFGLSCLVSARAEGQVGGAGSTVQGDVLRGEGVYLQGLGWYELNDAKSAAQNLETQRKLYEWNKQISADYRNEYNARVEREMRQRRLTEEARKKFLAEREQRLRAKPNGEDIRKGDALNALLADLSDPTIQESSWRGAKVPLPPDISIKLLAMRFSPRQGAKGSAELAKGLIALGRLDTRGRWPDVFPLDKLSSEIAAYESAYGKIKAQALAGRIDPSAPLELDKAIRALRDRVRVEVPVERNFRSIALKFVENLSDATRMFDGATLGFAREMISDTSEHEAHTVGELLAFMRKYRLRFAEAGESPGGEEMYARLFGLMQEQKRLLGGKDYPGPTPANIPGDAIAFRGKRYKVYRQQISWHEARKTCADLGGHLAIVLSGEENAFLARLTQEAGLDYAWLGLTDQEMEGRWRWVDGSAMSFDAWDRKRQQPNNGSHDGVAENFVLIASSAGGVWWDVRADGHGVRPVLGLGFLCQWD